ncbi:MAG: tyrosine-protein phosphatase [Clostridiales bacterium]|nr:tyrosine-protein phosphatase [Clostridiales bacterium]
MKRLLSLMMCFALLLCALPVFAEEISVTGKVTEVEKYGHALLDVTIEDFTKLGFELGDIVTVKAGTYEGDMPYFNGYYVEKGEYMLRAYPGHTCIAVCINYGKFAETAGIGIGDEVTVSLKQKAGALTVQEINNLVYTDAREDYASDEEFANFREVALGSIAPGRFYRAASAIDNKHNRAAFADKFIEAAGVNAVMNMANTDEELAALLTAEDFASPYYKALAEGGKVIALGMPVNFSSDEFAEGIVKGLTFLSENEAPYMVHCTEGKDRAGFASMLIEALMGASEEEIVKDYMQSYVNYYSVEAGSEKYDMIAEKNVMEMLRTVAGLEKGASLEGADLAKAAEAYLLAHGMDAAAIEALKTKLG